jgi:hypothetical protein
MHGQGMLVSLLLLLLHQPVSAPPAATAAAAAARLAGAPGQVRRLRPPSSRCSSSCSAGPSSSCSACCSPPMCSSRVATTCRSHSTPPGRSAPAPPGRALPPARLLALSSSAAAGQHSSARQCRAPATPTFSSMPFTERRLEFSAVNCASWRAGGRAEGSSRCVRLAAGGPGQSTPGARPQALPAQQSASRRRARCGRPPRPARCPPGARGSRSAPGARPPSPSAAA